MPRLAPRLEFVIDELILGLPRARIPGGLAWRGVLGVPMEPLLVAAAEHGEFRTRADAENDPSWKQLIPYLVVRDSDRIFLMKRSRAGADERLHDRYTIGVGGHVNPEDGGIVGGLHREWDEEIDADFTPDFQPIGLLNDDDNAVGAVHLGLVYEANAKGQPVGIRERDKLEGAFASVEQVAAVADDLETWSALLFDYLSRRAERG
jgi:predicted NUDIX family phosphoesterase